MILMVLPKYIHVGVISSQHLVFKGLLSQYKEVDIAIPSKFRPDLESVLENHEEVIWYENYLELLGHLKNYEWVYLRNNLTFFLFFLKKIFTGNKFKIFYDFRALAYIEKDLHDKSWIVKVRTFIFEFLAFHFSDGISAVSRKLADKLKKSFGKRKLKVIPCCIEKVKSFSEVLESKNSENSSVFKFVYVGSLSEWQCFDKIIKIYSSISEQLPSHLTIITQDTKKAEDYTQNINKDHYTIMFLSHDEVMDILPSFDFGFLIREDISVNNLASPIKFLEYTSNGVIPIMTKNIGDFSEEVESRGLGIILDKNLAIDCEQLKKMKSNREIISSLLCFSENYKFTNYVKDHPMLQL